MYWGVFNAHVGLKPRPTGVVVFGDVDHEWATQCVIFAQVYGVCNIFIESEASKCRSVFRPTESLNSAPLLLFATSMYWGVFNAHVGLKPRPTGLLCLVMSTINGRPTGGADCGVGCGADCVGRSLGRQKV